MAIPCFLWGAARSGTNAITWALESSANFTCYNEDDHAAFDDYFLRGNDVLADIVAHSDRPRVFFKAFSDTPRASTVMRFFPSARALYSIRRPTDTIASFVQEFGETAKLWIERFADAEAGNSGALLRLGASNREIYDRIRYEAAKATAPIRR